MRRLAIAALACACGATPPQQHGPGTIDPEPATSIMVEWKVEQGDGHMVDVSLVVDGKAIAIGALDAATEMEPGTPSTCALRAASPRRTELVCGDSNAYAADLVENELVVSRIGEQRTEVKRIVKRIPVAGDTLAVKMLVLPGSKL